MSACVWFKVFDASRCYLLTAWYIALDLVFQLENLPKTELDFCVVLWAMQWNEAMAKPTPIIDCLPHCIGSSITFFMHGIVHWFIGFLRSCLFAGWLFGYARVCICSKIGFEVVLMGLEKKLYLKWNEQQQWQHRRTYKWQSLKPNSSDAI